MRSARWILTQAPRATAAVEAALAQLRGAAPRAVVRAFEAKVRAAARPEAAEAAAASPSPSAAEAAAASPSPSPSRSAAASLRSAPTDFLFPRLAQLPRLLASLDDAPAACGDTPVAVATLVLRVLLRREAAAHAVATTALEDPRIDFLNPAEWYPAARKMRRRLVLHVGPTNSGKTYRALQLLERSSLGYYAGPLRLLAREIYETYRAKGIRCNLITGEEIVPDLDAHGNVAPILAGTIEMVPTTRRMDVCVIDEIQMIGDSRRGEAWTNAVLGVQARELHLCGEELAVPLIERLAAATGDEVEVRRYTRLGKLVVEKTPIAPPPPPAVPAALPAARLARRAPADGGAAFVESLRAGDCVVAFSKLKILRLKRDIERLSGNQLRVGVVYGALPPEVRSEEAARFNSGEYDVLVASDAIGMGLNLKINRIVFADSEKFDGLQRRALTVLQVKQIAGRAGRYQANGALVGYVTAIGHKNLRVVADRMRHDAAAVETAYIWPTPQIWARYISTFAEGTPLLEVMAQFEREFRARPRGLYDITELDTRRLLLKLFTHKGIRGKLTVEDQLRLSIAPVNLKRASELTVLQVKEYFANIGSAVSKDVIKLKVNDQNIVKKTPSTLMGYDHAIQTVGRLEEMHKLTLLFLWLSQRWPTLFVDKELATDMKSLIEKRITEELANLRRLKALRRGDKSARKHTST
jgi:ATP-dependent RNA helicase SUPV3L1/SUV3